MPQETPETPLLIAPQLKQIVDQLETLNQHMFHITELLLRLHLTLENAQ